jgi:spermidine synthase
MLTQRLLGLLPVIIHGRAREICVIGLGSGVTAGAALDAGIVERADVVEISPEVVAASHLFDRENGSVLARPGVRLIVGDGRSHLRLTPRRYDVIVSEPSNPWMAGVASLFTREFFQAARAHLKPGGLLCQWAHTYDIEAGDLRSIVATFSSVFPQGTIWLVGEGDVLLIGGVSDAPPALDHVAGRLGAGAVARALDEVAIPRAHAAFAVLSLFAGGPRELQAFASQAPLQTDDRTALEFSAPRGIYGRSANDNGTAIAALLGSRPPRERGGYSAAVQAVFDGATESDWAARGRMELKADAYQLAYDAFRRASRLNPADAGVLGGLSQAAALARKTDEELAWLTSVAAADPRNAAVRVERSHLLAAAGDFERAVEAAQEAMAIAPGSPEGAEQLASVLADAGDAGRLAAVADELLRRFPGDPSAHYFRASAWFMSGRPGDAEREARAALVGRPGDPRALNLIGAACATRGDRACAKTALEASIRANPRDSSAYVNLALFLMQEGNVSAAQSTFAEALAVDPTSASARSGYEQARVALEKP